MIVHDRRSTRPRGLAILEFSLVFPILVTLTVGLVLLGVGVSQYQMVAMMAREGARWASVRGAEYAQTTGNPAASASDIYNKAILPKAIAMDTSAISYQVAWLPNNQPGSKVSVTVTYQWVSLGFITSLNLTSTSVMTVSY